MESDPDYRATKAKVHFLVQLAGTSFSEIDRKYGLYRGASNEALRQPIPAAEKAIITELRVKLGRDNPDLHPFALWPRRYRDDGTRLPQEDLLADYRSRQGASPRQNGAVNETDGART